MRWKKKRRRRNCKINQVQEITKIQRINTNKFKFFANEEQEIETEKKQDTKLTFVSIERVS
jgi:hypothetical protein